MIYDIANIHTNGRHRKDLGDIQELAASILAVGLLHPVVIKPDGTLIAGERRLAACRHLGMTEIPVTIIEDLDDLYGALCAERDENVCRKDFAPSEAVAMAATIEPYERAAAAARKTSGINQYSEPSEKFSEGSGRAADKTAAAVGLSRPTLRKAQAVIEAAEADPDRFGDLVDQMDRTGRVDRAMQDLKKRKATKRIAAVEQANTELPPADRHYRVIYADPPWKYGNTMPDYFDEQAHHYTLMTVAQICELPIEALCMDDAVLFLWVTSPILAEAFDVISAWGFVYKASFVWDKIKHNMGHYNSVRHEFLLICTRGSCQPDVQKLFDSVQSIERTQHSAKPEFFREIIDTIYPHGPRIELFARQCSTGWDHYGNEVSRQPEHALD